MTTAEELYRLYPRHEGKRKAIFEIERSLLRLRDELLSEGMNGTDGIMWLRGQVTKYAESPAGNRGRYTPLPATWFHQSRYLDDERTWWLMTPTEESNLRRYREAQVGVFRPT